MNIKIIITVLLILICFESHSQNIYSALQHDRPIDLRENSNVSQINSTNKFYNSTGIEIHKEVSIINEKRRLVSELRYDETGKLIAKLSFKYDSTQTKSISSKFERWNKFTGYTSETSTYDYDEKGFLIKVSDRNKNNVLIRETFLTNNENGHPIELKLKEIDFNFSGKEIAEYDYINNSADTKVVDENGKVISTNKSKIDFSINKYPNSEYNELRDLVKSDNYEHEYKYDKHSNWTKQTIYKIVNGKRKKNRVFKRKIKYRQTL